MCLNLSQPKTHFALSPAASPCPAVSSGHVALPQHLIIGAGWKDPAVEGPLLQVTYGSAEESHLLGPRQQQTVTWKATKRLSGFDTASPFLVSCFLFSRGFGSKRSVFSVTIRSAALMQALRKQYLYLFWMQIKWLKTLPSKSDQAFSSTTAFHSFYFW